ncbi:adenosylcobinamide-GDP ribazoletransferase [Ancylobacter oerskovii]|uniref:Adenosylcobinamide-GDP ribazoletransferase n=1 Tax=Ancylobacter oerskovii TaxID=459519 RepID=A0ABW4YZU7_9HYPH|nr:adenosylcobinamide-GDP ribazoletransferase [Ancylobacter oerskovii]MBS7543799.1 adenosylcobinamide-GDP ribazoletransferase [Ancylobacter oerskovii]
MARRPTILLYLPETLRFLTRLPVPRFAWEPEAGPPDLDRLGPSFPLAGALIGLIGLIVHLTALVLLPGFVAATLAVGAMVLATGALHEDGFADTADGLGGMDRERRLAIMRDSRLGTFGALALMLALLLRIGALEGLAAISWAGAASALLAASSLARLGALAVVGALPSARPDGLAGRAGRPSVATLWKAGIAALAISAISLALANGWKELAGGLFLAAIAWIGIIRLASAKFGGQTGDVAGAAALTVEIAFLLGALIFARSIG